MVGIKPRALSMLGKYSARVLHPQLAYHILINFKDPNAHFYNQNMWSSSLVYLALIENFLLIDEFHIAYKLQVFPSLKLHLWDQQNIHLEKVHATDTEDLSLILGSHTVEGEN